MAKVQKKAATKGKSAAPAKKKAAPAPVKAKAPVAVKKPIAAKSAKPVAKAPVKKVEAKAALTKSSEAQKAKAPPKAPPAEVKKTAANLKAKAVVGKDSAAKTAAPMKKTPTVQREIPAYLDDLPENANSPLNSGYVAGALDFPREPLFSEDELAMFRNLLIEEKKKLLQKARQMVDSGNIALEKDEMYDEVDLATATIEQNLTFRLLDRDRKLLGEIDHALLKVQSGDYGYCEGTGEPIPKRRLELRPWTRHSVKYKEQLERMEKSGRGVADEDELY